MNSSGPDRAGGQVSDRTGNSQGRRERIGCLVLAAGAGTRFGGNKQLADLGGRPLLTHAIGVADSLDVDQRVLVLGSGAEAILRELRPGDIEPVRCPEWRKGISASLKTGIEALTDVDAVVVLLGDQPFVTAAAVNRLLERRSGRYRAIRATYRSGPGHPVVIERSLLAAIGNLEGDQGARQILDRDRTLEVPCDEVADPFDIDSRDDLIAARSRLAAGP